MSSYGFAVYFTQISSFWNIKPNHDQWVDQTCLWILNYIHHRSLSFLLYTGIFFFLSVESFLYFIESIQFRKSSAYMFLDSLFFLNRKLAWNRIAVQNCLFLRFITWSPIIINALVPNYIITGDYDLSSKSSTTFLSNKDINVHSTKDIRDTERKDI